MRNYSKQREAILTVLRETDTHPTANWIYAKVRETIPNISLGTVYRNLSLLSDMGEILRLQMGDGVDHFDATTAPHNHFICNSCGAVIDLEMENFDEINELACANFNGQIQGHITYFYGICPTCLQQDN